MSSQSQTMIPLSSRRRFLAGTLALAALPILQACGSAAPTPTETPAKLSTASTTSPTSPATQSTAAPAASAAVGENKTFTLHLWTHDFIIRDFFKDRAKEWVPQQTGWKLNYDFQAIASEGGAGDVFTKFLTAVAANEGVPEIMLIQIEQFTKFQKKDIALTALTDLTPLISEAGGVQNFIKLGDYSWKGKYFCVDTVAGAFVYYYREDLFRDAGVKLPIQTFDDFITEGQKLAAKGHYIDASDLPAKFVRWLELRNHNGVFDADGNVLLDTSEATETLQFMSDLIHKYKVMYLADTSTGETAAFQGNKIAGTTHADWWPPFVMNTEYKSTVGKWRAQLTPQMVKGVNKNTSWGGVGASIYQKAPNRDLVTDFYRYALLKPENHAKLMLDYGYWPSMRSSWKVPGMAEWKSKLLGDQAFGQIELQSSDNMVDMHYGAFWGESTTIVSKAVDSVINQNADPAQALKAAAQDIRTVVAKG